MLESPWDLARTNITNKGKKQIYTREETFIL